MTVAAIPVAAGQAGSPGGGSGILPETSGGIHPGSGSTGAAAAGGETGRQQWRQSLHAAGLKQSGVSADAASAPVIPPAAAGQSLGKSQLPPLALAAPKAALAKEPADFPPSRSTQEDSNLTGAGPAASDKSKPVHVAQKAAVMKDASASAAAQNLLASLTLPAAATAPSPMDPSSMTSRTAAKAAQLPGPADPAEVAAQSLNHAIGSPGTSEAGAPIAGQGMAAQTAAGTQQGTNAAGIPAKAEATPAGAAAAADHSAAPAAHISTLNPHNALASSALNAATQKDIASPAENATALAASVHASSERATAQPVDVHASTFAAKSSAPDSAALHAHADRNRATNANVSGVFASQAAANTAQLAGGQMQPVAQASAGVLNSHDAHASAAVDAASATSAHPADPFVTLDAASSGNSAAWVHAGPHTAEAGFQDPSLGWVGVRAESTAAGAIHASVLASSSDAAQALSGHLAGLHAYLSDHHSLTGTVTIARPDSSAGWSGFHQPQGQSQHQQGSSQGSNPGNGAPLFGGAFAGQSAPAAALPAAASAHAPSALAVHSAPATQRGGLISVMA